MDEQTQRDVAKGLQAGSRQAWLSLYDAYAQRVWTSVARMMEPNSAHIADVVQDTFLAAAASARGFDPDRGSLWSWLWGIARNQVALHYRRRGQRDRLHDALRQWRALDQDARSSLTDRLDAPPEVLASRELATLVRAVLATLPADYQRVLSAKYIDNVSAKELASELGDSTEAVRSRLARARAALRRALSELTDSDADRQ